MYRRILYAHDGADARAEQAFAHLVTFGTQAGAHITLCHVIPAPEGVDRPPGRSRSTPSQSVTRNEHLKALRARLLDAGVHEIGTLIIEGDPAESMVAAAADLECDLVIVVTAGRAGLARFFRGSVGDYVARHTPSAAVLLLRDPR